VEVVSHDEPAAISVFDRIGVRRFTMI